MPGPIEISFLNESRTTFDKWSAATGYLVEKGIGGITSTPTETLPALGGTTSMGMDQNVLSNLVGGVASIRVGWVSPTTGVCFGVQITMPVQVLHIGHQPYYETANGVGGHTVPTWSKPVSNPANPSSFPTTIGFHVTCTPKAGHTSLTVSVKITDL